LFLLIIIFLLLTIKQNRQKIILLSQKWNKKMIISTFLIQTLYGKINWMFKRAKLRIIT